MTRTAVHLPLDTPQPVTRYTGQVTYIYAFDVAYELSRTPLSTLLGQQVAQFQMDSNKRAPRQLFSIARRWSACRRWNALGRAGRCALSRR